MENTTKVNRLLDLVKRPQQAKRKPSNFALYWAWLFYNGVALLFDVIAAMTVYELVGKVAYAALTFAAGFLPLLMHEFLYTRAYASGWQKALAIIGACLSVVTIFSVGVIAGVINVLGLTANIQTLEIAMIISLILVAGGHALIAAFYFYIDDGIKAKQVRAESVAYHERRLEDIQRAKEILAAAEQGAKDEDEIASQFGGREVLDEILGQLRGEGSWASTPNQTQPMQPRASYPDSIPTETRGEKPAVVDSNKPIWREEPRSQPAPAPTPVNQNKPAPRPVPAQLGGSGQTYNFEKQGAGDGMVHFVSDGGDGSKTLCGVMYPNETTFITNECTCPNCKAIFAGRNPKSNSLVFKTTHPFRVKVAEDCEVGGVDLAAGQYVLAVKRSDDNYDISQIDTPTKPFAQLTEAGLEMLKNGAPACDDVPEVEATAQLPLSGFSHNGHKPGD